MCCVFFLSGRLWQNLARALWGWADAEWVRPRHEESCWQPLDQELWRRGTHWLVSQVRPRSNVFRRLSAAVVRLMTVRSDSSEPVGCVSVTIRCPLHSVVWVVFWFHFHSVCQEYFLDGGMKRMLEKDEKSATLAMGLTAASVSVQPYSTMPR